MNKEPQSPGYDLCAPVHGWLDERLEFVLRAVRVLCVHWLWLVWRISNGTELESPSALTLRLHHGWQYLGELGKEVGSDVE